MTEKLNDLEALLGDISDLTPEKMDKLVKESIGAFEELVNLMNNGSEEDKKKAMEGAEKLRENLEKQAEKAVEQLKISTDELDTFIENPDNFSEEEWEALQKAKGDLDSFKSTLFQKDEPKKESVKGNKKKQKPVWVAG